MQDRSASRDHQQAGLGRTHLATSLSQALGGGVTQDREGLPPLLPRVSLHTCLPPQAWVLCISGGCGISGSVCRHNIQTHTASRLPATQLQTPPAATAATALHPSPHMSGQTTVRQSVVLLGAGGEGGGGRTWTHNGCSFATDRILS